MPTTDRQQGFVSILTVLFFMTLISIITVGFTRFMIQEQRQQLEDELSKSAYNAAQVGVEDAKRAISYCFSLSGASRTACEAALYNQSCPGFNDLATFASIGIPASNGRTSITNESSATAPQGYSCVIVSDRGSVSGQANTELGVGGRMYELNTAGAPYQSVRLSWHQGNAPHYPVASFQNGNLRLPEWVEARYPAVLRVGIITIPDGSNFNMSNIDYYSTFLYPGGDSSSTETNVNLTAGAPLKRYNANCDIPSTSGYDCSALITTGPYQSNTRRYLVLNSIYRSTDFNISAYNGATFVPFVGVQYSIDSTGYTSGLSRRVKVNLSPGDRVLTIPNAIDTGLSFCKDFRVGSAAGSFQNNVREYCTPS